MNIKSPPDQHVITKCRVCARSLSFISSRQITNNIFKTTSCCKVFSCLHISCAIRVSSVLDHSYNSDEFTYENDNSTSLYCFICATNCFYCQKNHPLPPLPNASNQLNQDINIDSCVICNNWCYFLKKCKKDDHESICPECVNKNKGEKPNDKELQRQCISPISSDCDAALISEINDCIPELLSGKSKSKFTVDQWKNYFTVNFNHLHPNQHNIFSKNRMNTKPVYRMFLSARSIHQFLDSEQDSRVTVEMFNFFVDVFNFHGEYNPSTKQRSDKLPGMLFCKPNDDCH